MDRYEQKLPSLCNFAISRQHAFHALVRLKSTSLRHVSSLHCRHTLLPLKRIHRIEISVMKTFVQSNTPFMTERKEVKYSTDRLERAQVEVAAATVRFFLSVQGARFVTLSQWRANRCG